MKRLGRWFDNIWAMIRNPFLLRQERRKLAEMQAAHPGQSHWIGD